jgi:predicted MFS family arabinose efflux permease
MVRRLDAVLGGAHRRHVVAVLAAVLALDSSDKAVISAGATQLQTHLHIGKPEIGALLAASSAVGAAATIPAGILVDRMNRTRLLAAAILTWGGASALSGLAPSFGYLLAAQTLLGVVTAVAGPAIASLVGDFFPDSDRGRIWGYVLSGELVGAGFGFMVAGQLAVVSWRAPFFVLAGPSLAVWWLVRGLAEPARGGSGPGREPIAGRLDAERMPFMQAVRYVLQVRTNLVLVVASALGYFYFSGLRGFAVEFAKKQYHLGQSAATSLVFVIGAGAVGGVLVGGRISDRLLRSGRTAARVEVPGVAVLAAGLLFVPALVTHRLVLALLALVPAAACLGATNPPLDAARLDIMPPRLWGRAEAVRSVLRNAADAGAPAVFGVLAGTVFAGDAGLRYTFLCGLVVLFAASAVVLTWARRSYPRDAAAASSGQADGTGRDAAAGS